VATDSAPWALRSSRTEFENLINALRSRSSTEPLNLGFAATEIVRRYFVESWMPQSRNNLAHTENCFRYGVHRFKCQRCPRCELSAPNGGLSESQEDQHVSSECVSPCRKYQARECTRYLHSIPRATHRHTTLTPVYLPNFTEPLEALHKLLAETGYRNECGIMVRAPMKSL
jgi:hypothetical protein